MPEGWFVGETGGGSGGGTNLLTDTEATFETGLTTNWQVPPGTVFAETITRVTGGHTGSHAMEFYTAGADPSPLQAMLYRDIPITAGVTYTLRTWARPVNRGMSPMIRATSFNGTGGYGVATVIDTLFVVSGGMVAGAWDVVEGTVTFSTGSVYARILVAANNAGSSAAGDTIDFDDLFVGIATSPDLEVWG